MLILLCVIFVLSGAAGLVYESIWTRYLGLFVGHGAYAQVLVLVIFLGGMSVGALVIGRRAERVRQPLVWYALVELAVGIIGLCFHDVFVWATHTAYNTIFPALGPGALHAIAKWTIAALLILPQSILLGTTFPLMTAGVLRHRPTGAGRTIALLYFANSLGAAAGVLVAGFVLVAWVGLPGTLLTAAMANIVVAAAAWLVARRDPSADPAHPEAAAAVAPPAELSAPAALDARLTRLLLVVSFGTAVSSFTYEIGWIRMLSLVLGSATHSFELMLSAFILGLAIGAFIIRRRNADGDARTLTRLAWVQLAMGTLAVATLPVYAVSFDWMAAFMAAFTKANAGYTAFSLARYVICLAVMLPATICAGMTLPLVTRLLLRGPLGERALGQVYGVNTLGSIFGVGMAALVLMPLLGIRWLVVAGAAIDVGLGIALLAREGGTPGRATRHWAPVAAAVAIVALVGGMTHFNLDVLTSGVFRYGAVGRHDEHDMVSYVDGRTATVSVRRLMSNGGLSLATNGKPDASLGPEWFVPPTTPQPFTLDAATQVLIPLIVLAHAPQARTAAVIGQGSGMSSHSLLGDPRLTRVVTIEIEPAMIRASRAFYPANRRVFDDPRSHFAIDDARSYFAAQGEQYDLIISEPSTPWVAGVSGLFTREFYAHARRYLAPHGVFGQWIHLNEINDLLVLSVVRALAENFPDYALYNVGNGDILIVATNDAVLPAPDWSVFSLPPVASDLRRVPPLTPALLNALRFADARTLAPLAVSGGGGNSDFYPTLDGDAERTRYLGTGASGFAALGGERFALAAMLSNRRAPVNGEPYTPIASVPRLSAMELAARLRDQRWTDASPAMLAAGDRDRAAVAALASSAPPLEWHYWVGMVRDAEDARAGGSSGMVDTALFAAAERALARHAAPRQARDAVAFLRALAGGDDAGVSHAAEGLLAAGRHGDWWLPVDMLRDGTVVSRLRLGDVAGARRAFDSAGRQSPRPRDDVRTMLLYAWLRAAEERATPMRLTQR